MTDTEQKMTDDQEISYLMQLYFIYGKIEQANDAMIKAYETIHAEQDKGDAADAEVIAANQSILMENENIIADCEAFIAQDEGLSRLHKEFSREAGAEASED